MPNITIYVPDELFNRYRNDKKKKGLIVGWLAEYYGMAINKSRVVIKSTPAPADRIPHLAEPLIERYKPE
jgi:hypothetical protein